MSEPPLAGVSRLRLVDGIVAAFDRVEATGQPQWISLEGPSGWGKTRVIREVYGRLAKHRQPEPPYWPASILDGAAGVSERRKRIHPETVDRPADSLPAWFWWGVSCSTRGAAPSLALAQDLRQIEAHESWLESRWRQLASLRERSRHDVRRAAGAVAAEATTEAANRAIEFALGQAVPGLGLAWTLGRWTTRQVGARRERQRLVDEPAVIQPGAPTRDIVEDTAAMLTRMARPGLVLVVVVEDLHQADAELTELLGKLIRSDSAILILTTGWSGWLDDRRELASLLDTGSANDRTIRVRYDAPIPDGLPTDAGLGQLSEADMAAIVRFYFPGAVEETVRRLVQRYANPLPLELVCTLRRTRRRVQDGVLDLTEAEIAELPATIEELYRAIWRELPEELQEALVLSAWAIPSDMDSDRISADDRWDQQLTAAAGAALLDGGTDERGTAYAWTRTVGPLLRRFHEPVQREIARTDPTDLFTPQDQATFRAALVDSLRQLHDAALGNEVTAHRARLIVALHRAGLFAASPAVTGACLLIAESLLPYPRESPTVLALADLAEHVHHSLTEPTLDVTIAVTEVRTRALLELARWDEAIDALRDLAAELTRQHGADDRRTLAVRGRLASALSTAARWDDAISAYRDLIADRSRVLGPDAMSTLVAAHDLGAVLVAGGRYTEAAEHCRGLTDAMTRVLGPEHRSTLNSRLHLGRAVGRAGAWQRAAQQLTETVADCARLLGETDPATVVGRDYLADCLAELGRWDGAIAELETALRVRAASLGPTHPDTLLSRNNRDLMLGRAGRYADQLRHLPRTVQLHEQALGPHHPHTLLCRHNLVGALRQNGKPADAVIAGRELLAVAGPVLGAEHPQTLMTRALVAVSLLESGRFAEAAEEYAEAVFGLSLALGSRHPDTVAARSGYAGALSKLGRFDEACYVQRGLAADLTETFGPEHSQTLEAQADLARVLGDAGRLREADAMLAAVAQAYTRQFGPDHPDVLQARHNRAIYRGREGDWVSAGQDLDGVAADRARVLGADHPDTLGSRLAAAQSLAHGGLNNEALDALAVLLADLTRVRGAEHAETLAARTTIADVLEITGRFDESLTELRDVRGILVRRYGSLHPDAVELHNAIANMLARRQRWVEAEAEYVDVVEATARRFGVEHPKTLLRRHNWAVTLRRSGRFDASVAQLRQVIEIRRRILPPDHPHTLTTMDELASTLAEARQHGTNP